MKFLTGFRTYISTFVLAIAMVFAVAPLAQALEIKDAPVEVRNDFVVEPAKVEIFAKPGDKITKNLSVVNRTDKEQTFNVDVEDFTGSRDPNQFVVLLGQEKGPFSLKDYIKPEAKTFKLKSKQRATLLVTINIPLDAEPGGHFASVLVSTGSGDVATGEDAKAKTISRIGALYFVRVEGVAKEDGKLTDFRLAGPAQAFYSKGPFDFEVLYENNGSTHLTPSGKIEIKNMLGRTVQELPVQPFFSLPDSVRSAQAKWESPLAFGRYTATLSLDRGYKTSQSPTDTLTIAFWVLPWKLVLGFVAIVLVTIFIIQLFVRKFEIRKK